MNNSLDWYFWMRRVTFQNQDEEQASACRKANTSLQRSRKSFLSHHYDHRHSFEWEKIRGHPNLPVTTYLPSTLARGFEMPGETQSSMRIEPRIGLLHFGFRIASNRYSEFWSSNQLLSSYIRLYLENLIRRRREARSEIMKVNLANQGKPHEETIRWEDKALRIERRQERRARRAEEPRCLSCGWLHKLVIVI